MIYVFNLFRTHLKSSFLRYIFVCICDIGLVIPTAHCVVIEQLSDLLIILCQKNDSRGLVSILIARGQSCLYQDEQDLIVSSTWNGLSWLNYYLTYLGPLLSICFEMMVLLSFKCVKHKYKTSVQINQKIILTAKIRYLGNSPIMTNWESKSA